ncbi:hypothetical protein WDZ92_01180 [Nostoc sp. NIES-2111]
MDGFSYPGGRFADNLHAFLNDLTDPSLELVKEHASYQLLSDQKVVPIPGGIKGLSDELGSITAQKRKQMGVSTKEVDFSSLLKTVVDSTTGSHQTVSLLISNMVFRTDGEAPPDLAQFLARQREDIRSSLQGVEKIAVLLLRDTATYRIREKDGRKHVGYERPYYALLMGTPAALWHVTRNLNLDRRFTHSFWMQRLPKQGRLLPTSVVQGHPWGEGSYKRDRDPQNHNHIKEAEPGRDRRAFAFVAQADLEGLGPFSNLARDKRAWHVEPGSYTVLRVGPEKAFHLDPGYSDFMAVRQTGNLVSGSITMTLPYTIPDWVSTYSYADYRGISYESLQASGKSFGLKHIVEGISSVFAIDGQPIVTSTFTLTR